MKRTTSGDLARPDSRAAFSWVELVAVISALAVLTLLVLPVLAKGTESSDRLICAVNMRQLLSAVAIYVADNNGYLPHPSWGSDLTGPNNWCYATHLTSGRVAVSAANRSGPNAYTNQLPFYAAGQLARYLDSQRVLICPTDWRESMGSKGFLYMQRSLKLTSYTMNAAVIGYARLNPAGYGLTSKASLFAPDSVAFWEPDESNPFNFADAASRPSDGASRRHSPTCIIGTFGGRVEWIPLRTFFQLSTATNRNRLWCSPDTRDGH